MYIRKFHYFNKRPLDGFTPHEVAAVMCEINFYAVKAEFTSPHGPRSTRKAIRKKREKSQ